MSIYAAASCPERADFRPKRADFRPERAWGDKRTNGMTNESPPVFYRTLSPSGPLPKRQISGLRRPGIRTEKQMDKQKSMCSFGTAA